MIKRVFWIGVNAIIEIYRDRTVTGFLMIGLLFIAGGYIVADMSVVEKEKMFLDTGSAAIFIIGLFVSLLTGSNLLDRELREKQVLCTLSKPFPRSAWILGKASGLLVMLAAIIFILTLFLFLFVRLNTGLWVSAVLIAGLFIYLEMVVLSCYTLLFSTITTQYLALFFSIMVLLIGHMVDDLKIYWMSKSIAAQIISKALFYVIPNLEAFVAAPVLNGGLHVPGSLMLSMILYAGGYLVAALALAIVIMNRRELA